VDEEMEEFKDAEEAAQAQAAANWRIQKVETGF